MRKLFWLVLVMVGLGGSAFGQTYQKIQGYCEQGGQQVTTDGRQSTTKVQRSYPSCQITVYDTGTTNLASIASNSSGTPKSNPFTADSDGYWSWYALDGEYDVRMSGGGLVSPITRSGYWISSGGGGGSGITGSGTTDRYPIFTSSSSIGNSVFKQVGTSEFTPAATGKRINLGTGSQQTVEIANASVGGTTQNRIAKLTGAPSTAITATTSDTTKLIGIVAAGAGTTGSAQIVTNGNIACDFDGATTAGNYVGASTSSAGKCTDLGSTLPTSGVQVLGRVLSTIGSAGSADVYVFTGEQGRGGVAGSGTTNYLAYWTDSNTLGATNALFSIADSQFQFGYSVDIANGGLSELSLETDQILFKGGVSRANNAIMQTMKATASQTGAYQRFTTSGGSVRYEVDIDGDSKPRGVNYTWPSTLPISTGCLQVTTGGVISVVSCVSGSGVRYALNIKQAPYSCTGDGVTDDTTCFQTALNDADAAGGYSVYAPAATYKVTGLTIKGGVTLEGDGRDKTIIYSTTNATIVDAVVGTGTWAFTGPEIKELTIKGSIVAGSSQIGLKMDDASAYYGAKVSKVKIQDTGDNALYIGNVYSSTWSDIDLDNAADYPLLYNSVNMPANSFRNIYVHNLRASAPSAFRIKKGDFVCTGCNTQDNIVASSRAVAVGTKTGVDGDASNVGGFFDCTNCNFETWSSYGIYAYAYSLLNLRGTTTFAMDASGIGSGIPIYYENNGDGVDYFAQFVRRGVIEDSVIFANTVSDYANSQPIHAAGFAMIETSGFGPGLAGSTPLGTYRNTTTSANVPLSRKDGQRAVTSVTTSTAFAQPGVRYIEANCGAPCTITLPRADYYKTGQDIVIKDISGGAATNNITVTAGSGTVNGSTYIMDVNGQSATFLPNATSVDWRVTSTNGVVGTMVSARVPYGLTSNSLTTVSGFEYDSGSTVVKSPGRFWAAATSASNPSFSFTTDTDTGFYSSAANRMGFAANGADVLSMGTDGLRLGVASSVTGALNLAHASSSFITTITAGNAAAARTYVWPTNFGASGSVLTDAAGNGTLSWAVPSSSASLTSTFVGYGSGSNLLTGTSDFSYATSTKTLSIVNGSGASSIILNGTSDTSSVKFGAASMPGNQGGIFFPFVGGANSSGPGIWWGSSASYGSLNGIYLNNGFTFQGANSTHDHVKIASGTGTSSNGTVVWDFQPSSSALIATLSTSVTNTIHQGLQTTLTSTGTAAAGFGYGETVTLENGSGSNVLASYVRTSWGVATAGSENSKYEIQTNVAGGGLATAFTVEGDQHYGVVQAKGNQSGSFTVDFNLGNHVTMTATGNFTTVTFSNIKAGARYVLKITQDGTGGKTWTPPTTFKYPGGISGNILTATANAVDIFICDAFDTTNIWCNGLFDVKNP